jgi:hypothetical protein
MSKTVSSPLERRLYAALRRIAKDYQTPDQIRSTSEREFGLASSEALEYAYENIQHEAAMAIKGLRVAKEQHHAD